MGALTCFLCQILYSYIDASKLNITGDNAADFSPHSPRRQKKSHTFLSAELLLALFISERVSYSMNYKVIMVSNVISQLTDR